MNVKTDSPSGGTCSETQMIEEAMECGLCGNYPCTCDEPAYRRRFKILRPSIIRVGEVSFEIRPGCQDVVIEAPRTHVSSIQAIE